jgi:hypothetical protein
VIYLTYTTFALRESNEVLLAGGVEEGVGGLSWINLNSRAAGAK